MADSGWLTAGFVLLTLVLGGVNTWAAATSHSMNADGINYLDIGDAYWRGDWGTAINSVWSPMYSWILGTVIRIVNPSMRWEFPTVHLVNYAIYLMALGSFALFWRQLSLERRHSQGKDPRFSGISIPKWAWWPLGLCLFLWSAVTLIELWAVTPDMLMAAFVLIAAALLVHIRMGNASDGNSTLYGLVLGLGYLTKAIMFPLGLVFITTGALAIPDRRKAIRSAGLALGCFLLVSLPFIASVSSSKGRWTFGEIGKLTYVRLVNQVPYPHWQGVPPGNGNPLHPSRQILVNPPIYEFGEPIGGTYPISYDPSYWYEGVKPRFDLSQQIDTLVSSSILYLDAFVGGLGALTAGAALLNLLGRQTQIRLSDAIRSWSLLFPSLAALGLYGFVLVEGRYIAVFIILIIGELLAHIQLPEKEENSKLVGWLSLVMIVFTLMSVLTFHLKGWQGLNPPNLPDHSTALSPGPPTWPGQVAEALWADGVNPGDCVGVIGYAFDSYWARLGRFHIVSELLGEQANVFWTGGVSVHEQVLEAFQTSGAVAVVAEFVPPYVALDGWRQVGVSNYYYYLLGNREPDPG